MPPPIPSSVESVVPAVSYGMVPLPLLHGEAARRVRDEGRAEGVGRRGGLAETLVVDVEGHRVVVCV